MAASLHRQHIGPFSNANQQTFRMHANCTPHSDPTARCGDHATRNVPGHLKGVSAGGSARMPLLNGVARGACDCGAQLAGSSVADGLWPAPRPASATSASAEECSPEVRRWSSMSTSSSEGG